VGYAVWLGIACSAVFGVGAATAAAPPPTLTGESFSIPGQINPCQVGSSATFSFTFSGTATGPYSGPFSETITGTLNGGNSLSAFSASFTIASTAGNVTGTASGTATSSLGCGDGAGDTTGAVFGVPYQATIQTGTGTYADQGTSDLSSFAFGPSFATSLDQGFASSLPQPVLVAPTSFAQCFNGGWKSFGTMFKNLGQCVSFVATGGRRAQAAALDGTLRRAHHRHHLRHRHHRRRLGG
jgi:hypothetical protein